jgi:hypothetical protein
MFQRLVQKAVCIQEYVRAPFKNAKPRFPRAGLANRRVEGGSTMILSVLLAVLILIIGLRGAKLKIEIDL